QQLARHAPVDVKAFPVSEEFLQFLREEHSRGRKLVLATGADESTARQVAERFNIFSEIVASDGLVNRTGSKKVEQLIQKFGRGGFDYAGNSKVDLPIWEVAQERILVNGSASLQRKLEMAGGISRVFTPQRSFFRVLPRVLRAHQWAKNLLLFVPVVTGHQLTNPQTMWHIGLAFVLFCLCSSSVYVANDLHDLEADRRHRTKRHRAFASGQCPILAGLILAPLLAVLGLAGAAFLPPMFFGYLVLYYVASTAYSWFLKRVALLDVFVLAGLYTLRILAGHGATGIPYSSWLLGLSMFLFLSLALMKRYIELRRLVPDGSQAVAAAIIKRAIWPRCFRSVQPAVTWR
ncbi:MAG TPA: UbiA family prenyltransferase, partial [Candidatus Acidoferrum sp.]|nr:UbiA family prenyltransferase [Candidatus Acidoferrum sp.]